MTEKVETDEHSGAFWFYPTADFGTRISSLPEINK